MKNILWTLVGIFFVVTCISSFDWNPQFNAIMPILSVISLFAASFLHGFLRYGIKNMVIFFLITWVVSLFFEALSIQTGFPFGHYYYDQLIGPRIFQVPLIIMPAYFGMAYVSWTLAQVLTQQYSPKLSRYYVFIVPLLGTFIMVMWDLVMDPLSSTIGSLWAWVGGGFYFGVPLQNYFGWFLVVFIIFQIFALYLLTQDSQESKNYVSSKTYWLQAIALYGTQALFQILSPFTVQENTNIYAPMALVTVFTMGFVTILSCITLQNKVQYE